MRSSIGLADTQWPQVRALQFCPPLSLKKATVKKHRHLASFSFRF